MTECEMNIKMNLFCILLTFLAMQQKAEEKLEYSVPWIGNLNHNVIDICGNASNQKSQRGA